MHAVAHFVLSGLWFSGAKASRGAWPWSQPTMGTKSPAVGREGHREIKQMQRPWHTRDLRHIVTRSRIVKPTRSGCASALSTRSSNTSAGLDFEGNDTLGARPAPPSISTNSDKNLAGFLARPGLTVAVTSAVIGVPA